MKLLGWEYPTPEKEEVSPEFESWYESTIGNYDYCLYHMFDEFDNTLYIGITENLKNRMKQHFDSKEWIHEVAEVLVVQFPDLESVRDAEKRGIERFNPVYNNIYNGATKNVYKYFADRHPEYASRRRL